MKTIYIHALSPYYANAKAMNDKSVAVVIGTPNRTFEASAHVGQAAAGYNGFFYSFRALTVQKILKNDFSNPIQTGMEISVVEPASIIQYPDKTFAKVTVEDYMPMTTGAQYILFLTPGVPGRWVIINNNLGRLQYSPF